MLKAAVSGYSSCTVVLSPKQAIKIWFASERAVIRFNTSPARLALLACSDDCRGPSQSPE